MFLRLNSFFRGAVMVTVMLVSLVTATPLPANASVVAPPDGYGFGQGAAPLFTSFEDTTRELDAVAKTGATWLRVLVDWSKIEGTRGQYDWAYLDNIVNAARARASVCSASSPIHPSGRAPKARAC